MDFDTPCLPGLMIDWDSEFPRGHPGYNPYPSLVKFGAKKEPRRTRGPRSSQVPRPRPIRPEQPRGEHGPLFGPPNHDAAYDEQLRDINGTEGEVNPKYPYSALGMFKGVLDAAPRVMAQILARRAPTSPAAPIQFDADDGDDAEQYARHPGDPVHEPVPEHLYKLTVYHQNRPVAHDYVEGRSPSHALRRAEYISRTLARDAIHPRDYDPSAVHFHIQRVGHTDEPNDVGSDDATNLEKFPNRPSYADGPTRRE
jgi:hypothetical protein